MTKIPYTELPGTIGSIYKPWVNVFLRYKTTHKVTLPTIALIDSGADACFCLKDIGLWLGIPFKKTSLVRFTAANRTTFSALKVTITLNVAEKKFDCPFYFTDTLPLETPIILGQKGFFDHFKVTFDLQKKEFPLSSVYSTSVTTPTSQKGKERRPHQGPQIVSCLTTFG